MKRENEQAFQRFKTQPINALVITLLDFSKTFKLECDASRVKIGIVLFQGGHLIAYLTEKLHSAFLNYPTNDKELFALVRALQSLKCRYNGL